MRVAFVTVYDAEDPDEFNGIGRWMTSCLRSQPVDLRLVGPLPNHYRVLLGAKDRVYARVLRRRYYVERDPLRVRAWGRDVDAAAAEADVVLSGISPGSQPVAYAETETPIVIWTDATFAAALRQNRETLVALAAETRRAGLANESAALARCTFAIYTSDWAARSAREIYGLSEDAVHVLPLGPALEIDHDRAWVSAAIEARSRDLCRLLLVGTKWVGKGADVAVEAAVELNRRGVPTQLDIVGCEPPPGTRVPDCVRLHGFLRKGRDEDVALLRRLYAEAHLLILPTRAEAFGVVICEANAFGVPALATDVGGVPTALRHGVNGRLIPEQSGAAEYVDAVVELFEDRMLYESLALSSFGEYEARLNWTTIGARLRELLERAAARDRSR